MTTQTIDESIALLKKSLPGHLQVALHTVLAERAALLARVADAEVVAKDMRDTCVYSVQCFGPIPFQYVRDWADLLSPPTADPEISAPPQTARRLDCNGWGLNITGETANQFLGPAGGCKCGTVSASAASDSTVKESLTVGVEVAGYMASRHDGGRIYAEYPMLKAFPRGQEPLVRKSDYDAVIADLRDAQQCLYDQSQEIFRLAESVEKAQTDYDALRVELSQVITDCGYFERIAIHVAAQAGEAMARAEKAERELGAYKAAVSDSGDAGFSTNGNYETPADWITNRVAELMGEGG